MFENEEWRPIENFEHYSVSNYGRVKKNTSPNARAVSISDKGFPIIVLYGKDSKTQNLRQVNKLVANAFLPPPVFENMNAIWHIDGNLLNCHADNLRWDLRARVLEWNEMHRRGTPKYETPMVQNNRTGTVYRNAFECGMAEGEIESTIIWRVERQAASLDDTNARYRYTY